MIIRNADTKKTAEAMRRGEWPEPDPEVAAAYKGIEQATREVDEIASEVAAEMAKEQPNE